MGTEVNLRKEEKGNSKAYEKPAIVEALFVCGAGAFGARLRGDARLGGRPYLGRQAVLRRHAAL